VDLCSTPEWGRLKIFGLDWLHENTVFSGLGFVPEMSRLIVLQTVGVVDLLVMHPSKNAAEVILLCPTFVVTRVYVKLETSEAGTSEWVPSTEGESTTKTRKSTTMTRVSCEGRPGDSSSYLQIWRSELEWRCGLPHLLMYNLMSIKGRDTDGGFT
jgi:hypothetical protein